MRHPNSPDEAPHPLGAMVWLDGAAAASHRRADRCGELAKCAPDPALREALTLQAQEHRQMAAALAMMSALLLHCPAVRRPWWQRVWGWLRR